MSNNTFTLTLRFFLVSVLSLSSQVGLGALQDGACTDSQKSVTSTTATSTIGGRQVSYNANVGFIEVTAADQSSKACIFYTAYTVPTSKGTPRPLTFAFNGGPGSASLWLHMGLVGPQRIDMGTDGMEPPNPFALVNNDYSLLDLTDVVLIDPVATGFSSPEGSSSGNSFFGAKNDYKSIAGFIEDYLNQNSRWDSPKYVMGESYGGVRGSLLAHHLQSDLGIYLNGVVFVSPWLSTTTTNFGESDNDLPYELFLPSYATTGAYQKKSDGQFQAMQPADVLLAAEQFAGGRYADALRLGNDLPDDEFHAVAQIVSQFTGISQQQVENLDLRISDSDYFSGLLQDQDKVVGRYDARFVADRLPGAAGANAPDPSDSAVMGPFTAGINYYLRTDLKFSTPSPYVGMANLPQWPFDSDAQEFGVMDDLSQALIDNAGLKIFVASGMYDLACPYETVRYNFERLAPKLNVKNRVTIKKYPAGHMMYINPVALQSLKADLTQFFSN